MCLVKGQVFVIYSDIEKIQAGIGEKAALFLQYFSTFIVGFIIAFVHNWKLTLVVAVMLPLLAGLAGTIGKVAIYRSLHHFVLLYIDCSIVHCKGTKCLCCCRGCG